MSVGVKFCKNCGHSFYGDLAVYCKRCAHLPIPLEKPMSLALIEKISHFKLKIELVPSPLWYKSLASVAVPALWDNTRRKAYKLARYHCQVCGAGGTMICHELWQYDDSTCVAHLEGLQAICVMCNHVHHMGLAGLKSIGGQLDMNYVYQHFMAVNRCSWDDFCFASNYAQELYEHRSVLKWTQDFGRYSSLIVPI